MFGYQALAAPPLFARQPVFTADLRVFGHELLYRQGLASTQAVFADLDAATLTVVAGAFQLQPGDLSGSQKILVNFGRRTILDKAPYALPADKTVVQVEEGILLDDPLLAALDALKAEGFQIAVNGFQARPDAAPLLELADLAIVDVLGKTPESLAPILKPLHDRKITAMARKVEDEDAFATAKKLGFSLFQGYFFKKPEVVAGRRLASNEIARLKLLRLTQSDQPDADSLAEAIRSDVSLTYRLLSYLNSPLHGQRMEKLSIPRAIMYLGWTQLRHWLRVIALTDISPSGKAGELAFLSLQRARFFELAGTGQGLDQQQVDNLFTLGLFSLLDAMLQSPIEELLGNLPLDARVKEALLARTGPLAPWLTMTHCFEHGDWAGLERALVALDIPAELAAESYSQAMEFAASFTRKSS
ncbi:EAL and HDOD domain-containing protein [Fundidesulfovibrio terrae]|uniref:EAL and HDOD domain-containing protein n=1 Tax=Fundidesulfovibrio terrae TaxID=2922866 RepID=UPI001FAFE54C|nr:HDOD domain-containing protein [Fundidesulfovibrio terrae]